MTLCLLIHYDQHKKMKELGLVVGRGMEECREMLRHLFSDLSVYQKSPGRPMCLPGVYGPLGLELLYPNFSVRGGSRFEFR